MAGPGHNLDHFLLLNDTLLSFKSIPQKKYDGLGQVKGSFVCLFNFCISSSDGQHP